jgi:tripartite-type tricarboxylate transporter receptor subunit TctC
MRHTNRRLVVRAAMAALAICGWPHLASAEPVADFFRGKTISMFVSTGAGGGYDAIARAFVRHFSNRVPGNPTVVVQNMPGAGGLRATNSSTIARRPTAPRSASCMRA